MLLLKSKKLFRSCRVIFLFISVLNHGWIHAQELYVFTNPASNVPARSLTARFGMKTLSSYHNREREVRLQHEWQAGLTKNWMMSGGVSFSDMYFRSAQQWESARLYTKYRFLSKDDVHRHFRMAAFANASFSRNDLIYQELSGEGDNAAWQAGLVATQLIHKLALSGSLSYLSLIEREQKVDLGFPFAYTAWQSSFSTGYLVFPFSYTDYRQVNLNLYAEFLAQYAPGIRKGFIDIAPAVQFIVNSRTRFNAGGRFQLTGSSHRMAPRSWMISVEHTFLRVWK